MQQLEGRGARGGEEVEGGGGFRWSLNGYHLLPPPPPPSTAPLRLRLLLFPVLPATPPRREVAPLVNITSSIRILPLPSPPPLPPSISIRKIKKYWAIRQRCAPIKRRLRSIVSRVKWIASLFLLFYIIIYFYYYYYYYYYYYDYYWNEKWMNEFNPINRIGFGGMRSEAAYFVINAGIIWLPLNISLHLMEIDETSSWKSITIPTNFPLPPPPPPPSSSSPPVRPPSTC